MNDPQSPPLNIQSIGGDSWVTNQVQEAYARYSQTRWRLQTGGRAGGQSLFQLSAMATQILDKRAQRPFYNVNRQPIPPRNICVMGRALYADGSLWRVLPDGADLDVTPFVAGQDFYTRRSPRRSMRPAITVNDVSLDAGTPEFCAGQYLEFQLVFDPPPESVSQVSLWDLPGAPVNESWRPSPSGSLNYRFNPDLLTNLTTSCWYTSGWAAWPWLAPVCSSPTASTALRGSRAISASPGRVSRVLTIARPLSGSCGVLPYWWPTCSGA